jgi:myo-inositol-1(or 4)-monophosphatase
MTSSAPDASPERLRSIAVEATTTAADLVRASSLLDVVATKSSATDIVTATDVAAEDAIKSVLAERTPGARVLGEEGGQASVGDGPHGAIEWVVDPLDGTVNFTYGIPMTAISVAAIVAGRPVAAAVVDVTRAEVFEAHLGGGASLGGQAIAVGGCTDLHSALVVTGFAYAADRRVQHGRTVAELLGRVRDVRAFGSAALQLCWVACGRVDAYVERDIKPWDYAAGALISGEAGASVELPCFENDQLVLAANPPLLAKLRSEVS